MNFTVQTDLQMYEMIHKCSLFEVNDQVLLL